MSQQKWFEDALLINRDPNWYWNLESGSTRVDTSSKDLAMVTMEQFFEGFTKYRITDMQLCIYENTSIIPSGVCMWRGDKFLQKEENGFVVSYPEQEGLYRMYRDYGMDPVQMFLDIMREHNIRPWLTIRMNDAHHNESETAFLRDDFYYEARKKGWMIGKEYGYYSHCLDYSVEEVRARMLAYIREVVGKYDMFGLELDFMREIYSFDYRHTPERHEIMNSFIKEVRTILTEGGKLWGHPVRLMHRTHRSVEDAYEFGFDVGLWAKNGWIDAVVPTPRWECTDDAIPVEQWKKLVGPEVAVFPGIETLHLKDVNGELTQTMPEMSKAYYAAWNAQGADGIYYYNHHHNQLQRDLDVYMMRKDKLLEGTRRYIVTRQDICSGSMPCYKPLPLKVHEMATLSMNIGPVCEADRSVLILEFDGRIPPVIICNGVPVGPARSCAPAQGIREADGKTVVDLTGEKTYAYDCAGMVTEGPIRVCFHGNGVVSYLEFRIER